MRAVAVKGVTLEKGPHQGALGDTVITVKHPNGLRQAMLYDDDQIATPVRIEAMIDYEMGVANPESRAAVHEYCLTFIEGWDELIGNPGANGMQIGEMRTMAWAFVAGYEHAKAPAGSPVVVV